MIYVRHRVIEFDVNLCTISSLFIHYLLSQKCKGRDRDIQEINETYESQTLSDAENENCQTGSSQS